MEKCQPVTKAFATNSGVQLDFSRLILREIDSSEVQNAEDIAKLRSRMVAAERATAIAVDKLLDDAFEDKEQK